MLNGCLGVFAWTAQNARRRNVPSTSSLATLSSALPHCKSTIPREAPAYIEGHLAAFDPSSFENVGSASLPLLHASIRSPSPKPTFGLPALHHSALAPTASSSQATIAATLTPTCLYRAWQMCHSSSAPRIPHRSAASRHLGRLLTSNRASSLLQAYRLAVSSCLCALHLRMLSPSPRLMKSKRG